MSNVLHVIRRWVLPCYGKLKTHFVNVDFNNYVDLIIVYVMYYAYTIKNTRASVV